jgi:hypothetical protein
MKTIIIGDIHGRSIWKDIVTNEKPDKVVFVGDYFDSFDIGFTEQMFNFNELIELKKNSNFEVVLLIGNHDFHYLPNLNQTYSGHQRQFHFIIQERLNEVMELLTMCHKIDDLLITHAGISNQWIKYWVKEYNMNINESIDVIVNDLFKTNLNPFKFTGWDPSGDSAYSSPIWIRPNSLQTSNYDSFRNEYIQIVGHTPQNKIDINGHTTGGRYYYIDTLETSGEYLIYQDKKISSGRVS